MLNCDTLCLILGYSTGDLSPIIVSFRERVFWASFLSLFFHFFIFTFFCLLKLVNRRLQLQWTATPIAKQNTKTNTKTFSNTS